MAIMSPNAISSCSSGRVLDIILERPEEGRQRVCGETKTVGIVVDHLCHLRLMSSDGRVLLIEYIPDGEPHSRRRWDRKRMSGRQMPTPYRIRPQLQSWIFATKLLCEAGSRFMIAMGVLSPGDEEASGSRAGDYVASDVDGFIKIGAFLRRCCIRQTEFEERG